MSLDEDKVRVYQLLSDVICKFLLSMATIVAFFIILFFLIKADDTVPQIVFGTLEAIIGVTIAIVFKHYFPKKKIH